MGNTNRLGLTTKLLPACILIAVINGVNGQVSTNSAILVPEISNRIGGNGSLLEITVRLRSECVHKCNITTGCRSFFYRHGEGICQLQDVLYRTTADPALIVFTNTQYYKMKTVEPFFECPPYPMGSTYNTVVYPDNTDLIYRISTTYEIWSAAASTCGLDGNAGLVRVPSLNKHETLKTILMSCPGYDTDINDYWIDGSNANAADFFDMTQWVTSAGDLLPPTTLFWYSLSLKYEDKDHCISMDETVDYQWRNRKCDEQYLYICEKY